MINEGLLAAAAEVGDLHRAAMAYGTAKADARVAAGRRMNAIWQALRKGEKGPWLKLAGLQERTARKYRQEVLEADSIPERDSGTAPRRQVRQIDRARRSIVAAARRVSECTSDERKILGMEQLGALGIALERSALPPKRNDA